jgi:small multidrug resistance pump
MMVPPVAQGWVSLVVAIIFGVLGTIFMKLSHGLRHLRPTMYCGLSYLVSFAAMTLAVTVIQLSVVYAVWSGVGTILVSMVGILYFNEHLSRRKVLFLLLIVMGVIGIHLGDTIHIPAI